jgi:hypothetical protein
LRKLPHDERMYARAIPVNTRNISTMNIAQAVRGTVKLGTTQGGTGTVVTGWTSAEVENTAYTSADTFSVTFAASRLPDDFDEAWFSEQTDMYAEIRIGVPPDPSSWTPEDLPPPWIYGRVDKIKYCPFKRTVSIDGRDLSALLIDSKTTEKFQNMTASQVATLLANRHGLTPVVTATSTPIGNHDGFANRMESAVVSRAARAIPGSCAWAEPLL